MSLVVQKTRILIGMGTTKAVLMRFQIEIGTLLQIRVEAILCFILVNDLFIFDPSLKTFFETEF